MFWRCPNVFNGNNATMAHTVMAEIWRDFRSSNNGNAQRRRGSRQNRLQKKQTKSTGKVPVTGAKILLD